MGNQTKRVNAHEDRLRALELRQQGLSYRAIGAEIGKSSSQAHKYVARALQETTAEAVDDLRRLEGERLDAAQYAIWPQVMAGDVAALNGFIRLSERRAKLLGLDAPEKRELTGKDGEPLHPKGYMLISPDDWDHDDGDGS